jgi:hypothetical protein
MWQDGLNFGVQDFLLFCCNSSLTFLRSTARVMVLGRSLPFTKAHRVLVSLSLSRPDTSSPMNRASVRQSFKFSRLSYSLMPDNAGKWGMRIESSLVVRRVQTKRAFGGDIWLGFERLTCVPIQTRMVSKSMLSKEEIRWIKVCEFALCWSARCSGIFKDHNRLCLEKLESYLRRDHRALKWLKREVKRDSGPHACNGWPLFS